MTRRRSSMDHEHFASKGAKPSVQAQLVGTMFDSQPETERERLERDASIDARFKVFHADNPRVYEDLEKRALGLVAAGRTKFGIGLLWESMRFDAAMKVQTQQANDFKLNDHFRSRYARLLIERNPALAGVLETRTLRS